MLQMPAAVPVMQLLLPWARQRRWQALQQIRYDCYSNWYTMSQATVEAMAEVVNELAGMSGSMQASTRAQAHLQPLPAAHALSDEIAPTHTAVPGLLPPTPTP